MWIRYPSPFLQQVPTTAQKQQPSFFEENDHKIGGFKPQKPRAGMSSDFSPRRPRRCEPLGKLVKTSCCLLILQKIKITQMQQICIAILEMWVMQTLSAKYNSAQWCWSQRTAAAVKGQFRSVEVEKCSLPMPFPYTNISLGNCESPMN